MASAVPRRVPIVGPERDGRVGFATRSPPAGISSLPINSARVLYEPNDKHKKPWQRGKRGSLCPPHVTREEAQDMLARSVAYGTRRFATDGVRPYCAQQHTEDRWHGYPVGWEEVPPTVRAELMSQGGVSRRHIRQHWRGDPFR